MLEPGRRRITRSGNPDSLVVDLESSMLYDKFECPAAKYVCIVLLIAGCILIILYSKTWTIKSAPSLVSTTVNRSWVL